MILRNYLVQEASFFSPDFLSVPPVMLTAAAPLTVEVEMINFIYRPVELKEE